MIGFDTLNLSLRGICDLEFTTLGQALVAFITNMKDCFCGWMYFLKARWLYIFTALVFVISASSVECSSLSVISCDEIVTWNITGKSGLQVESDSYMLKNGIQVQVMEHLFSTLSSVVLNASNRSANIFVQIYCYSFTGIQPFLAEVGYGDEIVTCNIKDILLIGNIFELLSTLPSPFMGNVYSVCIFILKAPWFHFIILLGLVFRFFTTFTVSQNKVTRFRLLIKLRMALGRLRAKRLSYVELVSLRNSPACLHSLELSCGIAQARSLSVQIADASLEDLLYFYRASDVMALYLGKLIAKRTQESKKERRRKRKLRHFTTEAQRGNFINSFLLIILLLSLFVKSEENLGNVILYGVPGLRSISISKEETYSTIREEIWKFAPRFSNFYFVHRGLIIKDEDVVVN